MSLFAIGDLHLSFGVEKPMDIFRGWQNYTEILKNNWIENVSQDDTVVIPGDFSWGMKLSETAEDFKFLASLPGKKILLKGNHDFWWITPKKNIDFAAENGFDDLFFLQNNHFVYEDIGICGSRGWFFDDAEKYSKKVADREAIRLELSLRSAEDAGIKNKIAFLHFPPIYKDKVCEDLVELMQKYGVKQCYYGHLHGYAIGGAFCGTADGIEYSLVSADFLKFIPFRIR